MGTSKLRFIFLEKVNLRLHENVLEISLKVVYEHLRPEVQTTLTWSVCNTTHTILFLSILLSFAIFSS